jgi:acetoin utilization deacetylase AcuC-like enzyme
VILAITNAREKINSNLRFVILDTDAHHGDGTRQLLELSDDKNTLHLCLCDREWHSEDGLRHDFDVTWVTYDQDPDRDYLEVVEKALQIAASFPHDLFYWYMGFDTYRGDYGSLGLSRECFLQIADKVKAFAERYTGNRLQVVLAGGSLREMATWLIPRVIDKLSTWEE